MKKKPQPATETAKAGSIMLGLAPLVEQVRSLVQSARRAASTSVNSIQVLTNFEIGRLIVEHEQQGQHRAEYGKGTVKHLSTRLTADFGRGFSEDNLSNMHKFFLLWKDRSPQISETLSRKLPGTPAPFTLSWSHYTLLLNIKDTRHAYPDRNLASRYPTPIATGVIAGEGAIAGKM